MNVVVYLAAQWNALAARVRSAWPFPGTNARLSYNGLAGVTVEGIAGDDFTHPWQVRCAFEYFDPAVARFPGEGEWRAYLEPGFVNGRDAFIAMPQDWPTKPTRGGPTRDVPLTEETPPALSLTSWRNPLVSQTVGATLDGEIVFAAAEGYPPFFETLGVRPPAPGGRDAGPPNDETRTREIRALDIVLNKPRLGSALGVETLDPLTQNFTHQLQTTYLSDVYKGRGGRARLDAVPKFTPLESKLIDSPFLGLPMNSGDPQVDELKIATVYIVSPPNAGGDAVPDETWQAYPQHEVFWNLSHATRFVPPAKKLEPLKITTGLGLGILDFLGNAMLAPINSGLDEVTEFLQQADMRGLFWSI